MLCYLESILLLFTFGQRLLPTKPVWEECQCSWSKHISVSHKNVYQSASLALLAVTVTEHNLLGFSLSDWAPGIFGMISCFSSIFYFSAFFHVATASRPNILVIVADDLGYNDVSWHNPDIISPNLARHNFILDFADVQYAVIRSSSDKKSQICLTTITLAGLQKKDWCWNNHMCSQSVPQLGGQGIFIF